MQKPVNNVTPFKDYVTIAYAKFLIFVVSKRQVYTTKSHVRYNCSLNPHKARFFTGRVFVLLEHVGNFLIKTKPKLA